MIIEKRKLSDLKLWDKNPRAIKEVDLERLKNLIKKLGLFKPFIITDDGIILGGNMRYKACKELDINEVTVSVVDAKTGASVLDLFGGTGTTLIACEQTDRICYMMELDPKYCDVIRKRYHKLVNPDNWEETWLDQQ